MKRSTLTRFRPMSSTRIALASVPGSVYGMQSAACAATLIQVGSSLVNRSSKAPRYSRRKLTIAADRKASCFCVRADLSLIASAIFGTAVPRSVSVPVTAAATTTAQVDSIPRFYEEATA